MFILIIILLKCKCGRGELQRRIYRIILVYDSGRKVAKFINPIFSHTPILLRLNPNDNLYSLFSFPSQLATCPPLKEHRRAGGRAISLSKVEISIWMGYMMVYSIQHWSLWHVCWTRTKIEHPHRCWFANTSVMLTGDFLVLMLSERKKKSACLILQNQFSNKQRFKNLCSQCHNCAGIS